jgi:hypothetical protein
MTFAVLFLVVLRPQSYFIGAVSSIRIGSPAPAATKPNPVHPACLPSKIYDTLVAPLFFLKGS